MSQLLQHQRLQLTVGEHQLAERLLMKTCDETRYMTNE